jgi:pimeloyl-ACP methyl ester carboxylesterase
VKPLYFGDSRRPLFGVHHPPQGSGRRPGVVLCPPFGQESLRAHRSLRELATRLADAGFPALRFDYRGSGDSAGEPEEARLEGWVDDVATAVEEMRESTGERRVALAGLRLGGAVAALGARLVGGAEALVLWEPVFDGAAYLAELRRAHAEWVRDHAPGATVAPDEVLGFTLPAGLAADIAELRLDRISPVPARRTLVVASGEGGTRLWEGHPSVEQRVVPPVPVWLHAEGMSRVLVPGALIEAVVAWVEGASA